MWTTKLLTVMAFVAILGIGCSDREEKKPGPAKSGAAPAAIKLNFPHVIPMSADTPHNIGNFDQSTGTMAAGKDQAGALVFGPYLELDPGRYQVTFDIKTGGGKEPIIGKVDVNAFSEAQSDNPVAEQELQRAKNDQSITLDFSAVAGKKYEFRVWVNGNGDLSVKKITVDRKTQS